MGDSRRTRARCASLTRRQVLELGVRAGAGAWLGPTLSGCGGSGDPAAPGPGPSAAGGTLRFLPAFSGGDLPAALIRQEVWPGFPTDLWTLGGSYPSPTIRVAAGARFDARLVNRLGEATNIHWHGLVVPPEMDGFPTDLVAPGNSREYAFTAPPRAGTFWYHPHPEGRTAPQVYRGMAGFFLVEDAQERALGLPSGAADIPLLIQDRRVTPDRSFQYAPTPMDVQAGYLGDAVLVDGTPEARLAVGAGLCRLRLLNGSNARVYRLAFGDGRVFQVIASDGGLLDRPVATTRVDLGPGERLELLVDFAPDGVGGSVTLHSLAFAVSGGMGMGGMGGGQGRALAVMRFDVSRAPDGGFGVPRGLVPLQALDASHASGVRRFALAMGMGMRFTINGLSFDPDRIDFRVPLGEVEVWEVVNASTEPHPFHVHGTSFRVIDRRGPVPLGPQDLGWKDTVLTWPGEIVRIALRFEGFRGRYLLHCHNLEHEDAGMMSAFEVV